MILGYLGHFGGFWGIFLSYKRFKGRYGHFECCDSILGVLRAIWSFYRFWDNFIILEVLVLEPEKGKTFLAPKNVFFLINKKRFQFDQVFQLSQTLQNEENIF